MNQNLEKENKDIEKIDVNQNLEKKNWDQIRSIERKISQEIKLQITYKVKAD